MKNISVFGAAALLVISAAGLNAQGRGGRGGGGLPNNPPPTSPVTGDAVAGKQLYYDYSCYACHGYNGETGARAFVGNWGHLSSEDVFIKFLRERGDQAPEKKATTMPNFAATTLSDKQAKDIYAYIRTFKSNAPPVSDVPTLKAIIQAASQPAKN